MTDKHFCKIDSEFYGEKIDSIEQIYLRNLTGKELKLYVEFFFKQNTYMRFNIFLWFRRIIKKKNSR